MAQQVKNLTSIHEDVSSIPGLVQWVKESGVAANRGADCGYSWDPALLWLWCRPVAYGSDNAPGLGTSMCQGATLKGQKKKKLVNGISKNRIVLQYWK